MSALVNTLALWSRCPRAWANAARTLASVCTFLWSWLGRPWCRITLSLKERRVFLAPMGLALENLCSVMESWQEHILCGVMESWNIIAVKCTILDQFWKHTYHKILNFYTRTNNKSSPQFSLPSTQCYSGSHENWKASLPRWNYLTMTRGNIYWWSTECQALIS